MDKAIDSMIIHFERVQIMRVQMKENFGVCLKMNEWGKWFKFLFVSYLNYIF
jgi:hypothetical protein